MKTDFSPEEAQQLVIDVRPTAAKFAQQIAEFANNHECGNATAVAGLCASLVIQTIITTIALNNYEPGSREGETFLSRQYHAALQDAIERWKQPDLKTNFTKKH